MIYIYINYLRDRLTAHILFIQIYNFLISYIHLGVMFVKLKLLHYFMTHEVVFCGV